MSERHDDDLPRDELRRDDVLRERFSELRAETGARGVPDARAMLARARAEADASPELGVVGGGAAPRGHSRRRFVLAGAWTSAAMAAALAGILLTGRGGGDEADLEFERLVAAYATELGPAAVRSPTSGLLAVPGMELLRSVPTLGGLAPGLGPDATRSSPEEENR